MTRYRLLAAGLLCLLLLPGLARAQDVTSSACLTQIYQAMGREQRFFRAVVFGQQAPDNLEIGSVLFDKDGNSWRKIGNSAWKTLAKGYGGTTQTDAGMRVILETDPMCDAPDADVAASCVRLPRKGILETKRIPSSELIPPSLQALRALQCRLRAVCLLASASNANDAPDMIRITVPGCVPMRLRRLDTCAQQAGDITEVTVDACDKAREAAIAHEIATVETAFSYDAYRSLLQLGGVFDRLFGRFRQAILEPLRQAAEMVRGFNRIPCFLSQCDD